jgi:hypothetical protein
MPGKFDAALHCLSAVHTVYVLLQQLFWSVVFSTDWCLGRAHVVLGCVEVVH